jgi:hypothetical protein
VACVVDNNEEMEVRNICVNLKIQPDENKKTVNRAEAG